MSREILVLMIERTEICLAWLLTDQRGPMLRIAPE
jgi:hypothetical protein